MEDLKEEFKAACNNTTGCFNAIIQALQLPRRVVSSEVTRLLSYIDSVIDYYLKLDKQENVRYPIIYIPCSKKWAEEVCIEYVTYKIEMTYDKARLGHLKNELKRPIDSTGLGLSPDEQAQYQRTERKWRRHIRPLVREAQPTENVRNLVVCGQGIYNTITNRQNLMRFLNESPTTSITCSYAIAVEKQYQYVYNDFENIFCFEIKMVGRLI